MLTTTATIKVALYKGSYIEGISSFGDLELAQSVLSARKFAVSQEDNYIRHIFSGDLWLKGHETKINISDITVERFNVSYDQIAN